MKRMMGLFLGSRFGLRLALGFGLALGSVTLSQAAPVSAGLARTADVALDSSRALVTDVGYRRGHYRRAHYGYGRPVHARRYYGRPVYYSRPVRYRQVYSAPVYGYGYGYPAYYGQSCYIKVRKVYTLYGLVRKPVRICNY
jgi:hypothetical protein